MKKRNLITGKILVLFIFLFTVSQLNIVSRVYASEYDSVSENKQTDSNNLSSSEETTQEGASENATEAVQENATETVQENATETVQENATEAVQENATEAVQENATEAVQENATEAVSGTVTETVPIVVPANKSTLKNFLDKANALDSELYTAATYKKVTSAIKSAQKVYDNESATQEQVNKVTKTLQNAIDGLLPEPQPRKVSGTTYYYNVVDFGADGSDKLSDGKALQWVLDKAAEDRKIIISVPAGIYYISQTLHIHSNTTLNLDTNAIIIRTDSVLDTCNMIKNTDYKNKSTPYKGYTLSHDIIINGGTWDGGNIDKAKSEKNLLYFGHAENITISNTTIMNCYGSHAIEFAGVKDSTIKGCKIKGFRYSPDLFTSEAIQLDICYKDSDGDWAPSYTVDKTTCKNIIIEKNVITDYPRGVGAHHVLKGSEYDNIIIRNNKFLRSSASAQGKCMVGVFIMGAKNLTVSKNQIEHYYYGIMIKRSTQMTVKNNKLKYNESANLVYESCDVPDIRARFTVTSDKIKSKKLIYTCPNLKSGYVKTGGKTYKFRKMSSEHKVKLKKKIKKNQKMSFYGRDKSGNYYYRIYYTKK